METGSLRRALGIRIAVVVALLAWTSSMTGYFHWGVIGSLWALFAVPRYLAGRSETSRQANAGAAVLLIAGAFAGCTRQRMKLEAEFQPVISALEAYRSERKEYPPDLQALVPKYLPALPNCSRAGMIENPFYVPRDYHGGPGFYLECSWGGQGHHYYSSDSGAWDERGG
jgi:hypothetical protein